MRRLALSLALLSLVTLPALAAEQKPHRTPSAAQQAQQERMRQCSTSAKEKGMRGDPRKAFTKECLAKRGTG